MRIAVTGGSGFIGSHVARQLVGAGHRVVVVDTRPPAVAGAEWRRVDLIDGSATTDAIVDVDVIYHLAAVANVNEAFAEPRRCVDANIAATANVLEAARANRVDRVIFASTVWVYQASGSGDASEGASFSPAMVRHLYTASKLAGEMLCQTYWQLYSVPFTILRYGIPYGPGMRDEMVIAAFVKRVLQGQAITILGDGRQYRRFVFVEDLAEGNVCALAEAARNQVYNLEGTESVSVLEIARALDAILGGVRIEFAPARQGDFAGAVVPAEKALRELGWRARTPFLDGLKTTVDWLVRRGAAAAEAAAG